MLKTTKEIVLILTGISIWFISCQNKNIQDSDKKQQTLTAAFDSVNAANKQYTSNPVTCENYATVKTELGIVTNNVWNKRAAGNREWSQCIVKKTDGDSTFFGWTWSWPYGNRAIFGYPSIKIGSSPWAPEPRFDDRFPLEISRIEKLTVTFDVETNSNGNYNLATSMWLIREPNLSSKPNKSIIAAEIMFWTFATEGCFHPAGKKLGEVQLDDEIWEVWFEKNWSDVSMQNKNSWVYIAFKARKSAFKTTFNALELLRYAIQKKFISESLLIADIQLGNEVMSGSGITWVKIFKIDTELKSAIHN